MAGGWIELFRGFEREYQNTTAIASQATSRLERKKAGLRRTLSGLLWLLDCAVHDQFGGVATEERWVGAKAPGGDATAGRRGYPVVVVVVDGVRSVGEPARRRTTRYVANVLVQICQNGRAGPLLPLYSNRILKQ